MSGCKRRRVHGFTLVELMVVVGILAILSAFAVPSYLRHGLRARRVDAHQALLSIAMAQERYYAAHNRYANNLADIGFTKGMSEKGYYHLDVSGDSATFTAFALPATGGLQENDDCQSLKINQLGDKTSARSTSNGSCW